MSLTLNWFTIIIVISISLKYSSCLRITSPSRHYRNVSEEVARSYRPVIIIGGIFNKAETFDDMKNFIQKEHPGTEVYVSKAVLHTDTLFESMWRQVDLFYEELEPIMRRAENGVNIIGHSQGGLIARGIIESKNHTVRNFISMASPQAGHYGDAYMHLIHLEKETAYKYFYSEHYQNSYSVPGYWNDPHHQEEYLNLCKFLPLLNNEKKDAQNEEYKTNFLKLNKLVLLDSPDDGVINPWQSSHFSFYNEKEEVINFKQRNIYKEDLFGLKTLDRTKRLQVISVEGVSHREWHSRQDIFQSCILPWLD